MAKPTLKNLDAGQLDMMWNFLRFKNSTYNLADIEALEDSLNHIRQAVIQKSGGQEEYKKSFETNREDIGTYINLVVISAMTIYLGGGFEKLKGEMNVQKEEEK